PDSTVIYRVDATTNTKTPLFDVGRIREAIQAATGRTPAYRGLPFSAFTWIEPGKAVKFTVDDRDFVLDVTSYRLRQVPSPTLAERERVVPKRVNPGLFGWPIMELPSPDGRWLATHKEHILWLRSTQDGRSV